MKSTFSFKILKPLAFILGMLCFLNPAKAQPCGAGFVWYVQPGTTIVTFQDTSFVAVGDTIISYDWTFGDGTLGNGPFNVHTYPQAVQYLACLKITSMNGCIDSVCQVVSIPPCTITVSIFADTTQNSMTATASGGTPPYSYMWSNGAIGSYITGLAPGTYCVTVTDAMGCMGTGCATFTVVSTCSITMWYGSNCNGGIVNFSSATSGTVDSVYWDFGDSSYYTGSSPSHQYDSTAVYYVCAYAYYNGSVCTQYCSQVYAQAATNSNVCGIVFEDANGNGVKDSTELLVPNQNIYVYGTGSQCWTMTDSSGYYSFNLPPGTYTIYYCPDTTSAYIQTFPVDSDWFCGMYMNVTVVANQTVCGYNFGVQQTAVTIQGMIYADSNFNAVYDAGEYGIPNQSLQIGPFTTFTTSSGAYSANLPVGNYTVSYTPTGAYYLYSLTSPSSIVVNALTPGVYANNNFGLNIPAGSNNLSVTLVPYTTVRPGFPAYYNIYVTNVGALPVAATLTMIHDSLLNFSSASPTESSYNVASRTLTWNLPIITPGYSSSVMVYFTTSLAAILGTTTFELANVMPATGTDIDLSNNMDSVHQTVSNSWDPNNKLVTHTNVVNPDFQLVSAINTDQHIDYVINFQNTGTASALNIIVVDELSTNLDENSYQLLSTSHNCNASRNGNTVNYIFSNINLADSNSNELASHGQIKFRINAKNNLPAGTVLSDLAKIYFDFNLPVITNNTNVTMVNALSLNETGNNLFHLMISPNPVHAGSLISYSLNESSAIKLEVIDVAGKVCAVIANEKQIAGQHHLQLKTNLNNGFYFLRLTINNNQQLLKFSVMK